MAAARDQVAIASGFPAVVPVVRGRPREGPTRPDLHLIPLPVVGMIGRVSQRSAQPPDRPLQRSAALGRGAARVVEPVLEVEVAGPSARAVASPSRGALGVTGPAVDHMGEGDDLPSLARADDLATSRPHGASITTAFAEV